MHLRRRRLVVRQVVGRGRTTWRSTGGTRPAGRGEAAFDGCTAEFRSKLSSKLPMVTAQLHFRIYCASFVVLVCA